MIRYFGYGSNMDMTALRAKGVSPSASVPARLPGWRLAFSVEHFFRHEGGVGNIEETGDPADAVLGILHSCNDADLAALDRLEAKGEGYDRIELTFDTPDGLLPGFVYVGLPKYVNTALLPTRRYLNILVRGAEAAGIETAYVDWLRNHPIHVPARRPAFSGTGPMYQAADLSPMMTVLGGHVFDMTDARDQHSIAQKWFGGKDVTVFHLKRNDASDGSETLDDVIAGRLSDAQATYLNTYLHAFAEEYKHLGLFDYSSLTPERVLT